MRFTFFRFLLVFFVEFSFQYYPVNITAVAFQLPCLPKQPGKCRRLSAAQRSRSETLFAKPKRSAASNLVTVSARSRELSACRAPRYELLPKANDASRRLVARLSTRRPSNCAASKSRNWPRKSSSTETESSPPTRRRPPSPLPCSRSTTSPCPSPPSAAISTLWI